MSPKWTLMNIIHKCSVLISLGEVWPLQLVNLDFRLNLIWSWSDLLHTPRGRSSLYFSVIRTYAWAVIAFAFSSRLISTSWVSFVLVPLSKIRRQIYIFVQIRHYGLLLYETDTVTIKPESSTPLAQKTVITHDPGSVPSTSDTHSPSP
jgi:hypothetical protein